jgi:hypothetical protein
MEIVTRVVSKPGIGKHRGQERRASVRLEVLESRTLMSGTPHIAAAAVTAAHGLSSRPGDLRRSSPAC